MDFKELAANLGIDEADFMELVELFISTAREDINRIEAGLSAGDAQAAAAASHSIKGAAGNLGFMDMAGIAQTMEMQAKNNNLSGFDDLLSRLKALLEKIESADH